MAGMTREREYTREITRTGKVPLSSKIFQGFGGLVNSHKDFAFGTFVLLYYSQILNLPASVVSVVIGISLIVDAVSDPIVGSISDNFKSKLGRRHPFMFGAAVPFGLSMYFLFAPPTGLGDVALVAWLLTFIILARLAFTFFIVPWNAIAAEFSTDYVERTSIITYRYLVGWSGGIMFYLFTWAYLFPNTEEYPAGQLNPEYYPLFGMVVGCLVTLWALVSAWGTRKEIPYILQPVKPTPRFTLKRTFDEVMLALTSANFRRLFILSLLFSGIAGVGGVFDIYMNTYFWGLTPTELRWFALAGIGALVAFATVPILQLKFDKNIMLQVGLSIVMVLAITKVCLRFWNVLPENGDPLLLQILVGFSIVSTYMLTVCGIMVGSLVADMLDEQELDTYRRQEGVFASALSFSSKATSSVGLILGGFLLDFVISLPRQAQPGTIDNDILFRLAFTDGVALPLLFFIPIYLISRMTMTRARLADIQEKLHARRVEEDA